MIYFNFKLEFKFIWKHWGKPHNLVKSSKFYVSVSIYLIYLGSMFNIQK
jgi:hypothetical protein